MNGKTPPGMFPSIAEGSQGWPWASAAMRKIEDDIPCAIDSDVSIMIAGESGVGRKFVANLIHQRSRRGRAPFLVASCPDVLESLPPSSALGGRFASESADRFTHGLLKTVSNGSLVFEEIEKISFPLQSRLMRFIESQTASFSSVRLMSATSPDFFERVRSRQFRDDLFYRLNVIHFTIPPLRDRPEDIPILVRHYLCFYGQAEAPRLSIAAWRRLVAYPWPGNVLELKAVTRKLAGQRLARLVEPDDLPPQIARCSAPPGSN
jgi:two-component system response regulator AtoC